MNLYQIIHLSRLLKDGKIVDYLTRPDGQIMVRRMRHPRVPAMKIHEDHQPLPLLARTDRLVGTGRYTTVVISGRGADLASYRRPGRNVLLVNFE